MSDYSALDDGLATLAPFSDTLANKLTNHAPMVAEALCAMGRGNAVAGWIADYLPGMAPKPDPQAPVTEDNWQDALGDEPRSTDWRLFFESQIAQQGWRVVTAEWAARLAPGLCGAAAHGVIRTGHAVRALQVSETPLRVAELAEGLALWAASYQALPTDETPRVEASADPANALAKVALVPEDKRRNDGSITRALQQVGQAPDFGQAIYRLDGAGQLDDVADRLAIALAHLFRAQAHNFISGIVFCHAITALSAIVKIAPLMEPAAAQRLLAYGWQAGCGLYAAYAQQPAPHAHDEIAAERPDDIIAQAVAHGDEHVIKLAETCLQFYKRTADDVFLTVPAHMRAVAH